MILSTCDKKYHAAAFTLIELSIVLVIIGLIVGGVLVGQDLIRSATIRATISQIEKYNSAVNTFRGKYGALPGDLNATVATQFGFSARGASRGQGDGNFLVEGIDNSDPYAYGCSQGGGETSMFWVDLTSANGLNLNLIESSFNTATSTTYPSTLVVGTGLSAYFPSAKVGRGNFVYVYSGGVDPGGINLSGADGKNYYGIAIITRVDQEIGSNPGLTVREAYEIDKKMDDGLPKAGIVTAMYDNAAIGWSPYDVSDTSVTCINNTTRTYSININNGAGLNCALSFKFQ